MDESRREYNREYYRAHPDKYRRTADQQIRHNASRRRRYASDPVFRDRAIKSAKATRSAEHPDRRKARQYGVSIEEIELMTNDGCAICHASFDLPRVIRHIDHDHKTGAVRGTLCQDCNLALGHLHDDPIVAQRLVDYLMSGGVRRYA